MVIQEEAHSNKDGKAPKNEDLIQREKPLDIVTGPAGQLAKVTSISDDGRVVYFKLRDGKTSWFDLPNPTEPICAVGDVLILSSVLYLKCVGKSGPRWPGFGQRSWSRQRAWGLRW